MERQRQELMEAETFWLLYRALRGQVYVLPELFYRGEKAVGGIVSLAVYVNKKVAEEVPVH